MRPADSYDAFALVYDRGLGRFFFEGVRPLLDRMDRQYPAVRRTHLDLACGTGLVVRHFRSKGFDSVGCDASVSMLSEARRRGDSVFAADFRDFSLRRTFGRITCLYDSLNHVMDDEDLSKIFDAVHAVMDRESLFWFDVNHPSTYSTVWAIADPYKAGGDGWSLSIDTAFDEGRNLAVARVTGSCEVAGELVDINEVHHQRAWDDADVRRLLLASGLRVVEQFRFNPFGFGGNSDATMKLMYVAALDEEA